MGAGRRKKNEIDLLSTQVWEHGLELRSGKNAGQLEKQLNPGLTKIRDAGKVTRPRLMDRYRDGKVIPSDRPSKRRFTKRRMEWLLAGRVGKRSHKLGLSIISRAEFIYGGSAFEFRRPLWRLLNKELRILDDVYEEMELLNWDLAQLLLNAPYDHESSWARKPFTREVALRIEKHGSLDALEALILLAYEARITRNVDQFALVIRSYRLLIRNLRKSALVAPFVDKIDRIAGRRLYLLGRSLCEKMMIFPERVTRFKNKA